MAWVSAQVPPALNVASSAKTIGGVPGGVAADVVTIHAPIRVSPSAFTLVVAPETHKPVNTIQPAAKHSPCFFTVFLLRYSAWDMGRSWEQSRPVPLNYTVLDRRFPTLLKRKSGPKTVMSNLGIFRLSGQVEWQAPTGYGSFAVTRAEPSGLEGAMSASSSEITQLLRAWRDGHDGALERLMPLVYQELHQAARRHMASENSAQTLQTTALVNELYLRLVDFPEISWQNRAHFFAVCSKVMRRILVDLARSRRAQKRGGGAEDLPFDEKLFFGARPSWDLLALDEAMNRLAALDPRKSQVVEMRFFGGLSVEETAGVLKVSPETVLRDWRLSRVWLFRALSAEASDGI